MSLGGVLVTGATTPIGERLCRSLLADQNVDHVLAVGHHPPERALPFSHGERLVYRQVDLSRSRAVHKLLFGIARDLKIQVVMHLSMHRSLQGRGSRVHAHNVDSLRSLLALSERHPTIRRLVFKSHFEVYQIQHNLPVLITEDHPLNMAGGAPQWLRDRVEADITACTRMGLSDLEIMVLRCAEVLAPGTGSQLFDYLASSVCMRPAGYDPVLNLLSLSDVVRALELACKSSGTQGVVNIPGADSLPLSECIHRWGRTSLPLPDLLLSPAFRIRRRLRGAQFSYGMNRRRFHYAAVADGTRAAELIGYHPENPIDWPAEAQELGSQR
ncbi:MAG: NAD-dependent epimerase/dehydratase family protein [Myxococcota bacterium]|jgi:nucleoside-diphosphate-sugar epimerase|nr:NAD-dependent epimerase/dehydratase family protein [Myxococcota bacterium]